MHTLSRRHASPLSLSALILAITGCGASQMTDVSPDPVTLPQALSEKDVTRRNLMWQASQLASEGRFVEAAKAYEGAEGNARIGPHVYGEYIWKVTNRFAFDWEELRGTIADTWDPISDLVPIEEGYRELSSADDSETERCIALIVDANLHIARALVWQRAAPNATPPAGWIARATAVLRVAHDFWPYDSSTVGALSWLAALEGKTDDVVSHGNVVHKMYTTGYACYAAARAMELVPGRTLEAMKFFEQAMFVEPAVPHMHRELAAAYDRVGKSKEAARERKIVKLLLERAKEKREE